MVRAKSDFPSTWALDGGAVLPGFSLPLAQLFARSPKVKGRRKKKN